MMMVMMIELHSAITARREARPYNCCTGPDTPTLAARLPADKKIYF